MIIIISFIEADHKAFFMPFSPSAKVALSCSRSAGGCSTSILVSMPRGLKLPVSSEPTSESR